MEGDNNLQALIGALHEHAHEISRRRRQQVQEDEASLKRVIDKLNLHSCSVSREGSASRLETEEIKKAYQKAREDRDEYKFQLNVCKTKIKELKNELETVRLNQTQHNISIVADLTHNSERKSCAYTFKVQPGDSSNTNDAKGELNTILSEETYKRELNYLHKTNEQCYEEIRKLKSNLVSQEALLEKLNSYEGEINKLKKITEEKQEKMMNMQIVFDEKLKNTKRDYIAQISALNNRIKELEMVRDALNIDLGAAQEEIRSLQLSLHKPVEEVTEFSMDIPDKVVSNAQQVKNRTSNEKEELLNVNTRREKRCELQAIENVIEHEHPTLMRMSEIPLIDRQRAIVDEVKDLNQGVTRGTKRGQRGGKGSKKELAASQKEEAKKVKSSDDKNSDTLQNIENESIDAISSNARKGVRTRIVNPRKKAIDSRTAPINNKQNKKLRAKLEADENVEPSSLEYSSCSLNGTLDKIKLAGGTSTPMAKVLKKVQDDSKRTNRRRNK